MLVLCSCAAALRHTVGLVMTNSRSFPASASV